LIKSPHLIILSFVYFDDLIISNMVFLKRIQLCVRL